jgi:hypothetical protein
MAAAVSSRASADGAHGRLWAYDEPLSCRYTANLRARIEDDGGGYQLRTNMLRFRCEHDFTAPADSTRRILRFGESFTAGTGAGNPRCNGNVLVQRVAARYALAPLRSLAQAPARQLRQARLSQRRNVEHGCVFPAFYRRRPA